MPLDFFFVCAPVSNYALFFVLLIRTSHESNCNDVPRAAFLEHR